MMKSICIITTAHAPNDVRVTHRVGRSFVERGYKVTWVGPKQELTERFYSIDFEFYPKSKNRLVFINAFRLYNMVKSLPRFDIYLAVDPDSAIVGNLISKKRNSISIFDIHERYHDDLISSINPYFVRKIVGFFVFRLMAFAIKKSDLVIGVGVTRLNPFRKYLKNSMIIRHCLPKEFGRGQISPHTAVSDTINVIHGKYAKTRGTMTVIEAIQIIKNRGQFPVKFHFYKLGGAQAKSNLEEWESIINERGISDLVVLHENQPFDKMMEHLRMMDFGLITYSRDMGVNAMPNRYFEYIAFGIPSVIPDYSIELTALNSEFNLSVETDMEDASHIADALIQLFGNEDLVLKLRQNNLNAFANELFFEKEVNKLFNWIDNYGL